MHFNFCCEDRQVPRDVVLDDGEYYCTCCGTCLGKIFVWNYNDLKNYKFNRSKPYDPKNHASHVLNCLQCLQANKPGPEVLAKLKKGGISKESLRKSAWRNVRKHLTYVWCELNGIEHLRIVPKHREILINEICNTPKIKKQRTSYHKIIIQIIEVHPEMSYILKYLNLPQRD